MSQNKAVFNLPLTNISTDVVKNTEMLADKIFPEIPVVQTDGLLAGYGLDHVRFVETEYSGKGKYPTIDIYNRTSQGYNIKKYPLATTLTEEDYANVTQPFDAEKDATMHLTSLLMIQKEVGMATLLQTIGNYANSDTLTGTDQYNDEDNSNPLTDFELAIRAIEDETGQTPNKCIMSAKVAGQLKKHPQIVDRLGFKFNQPGRITDAQLASVLDVSELLIGKGVYNTAKEGQTPSLSPIWGKDIIFLHTPKTAAKHTVSFGYRVQKVKGIRTFKNSINNPPNAKEILTDMWYQNLLSTSNDGAGYIIKDAIA